MSKHPIYALNAGPNLVHIFTPSRKPTYYVCGSNKVKEGEVLNMPMPCPFETLQTFTAAKELVFPANVFALTATLTDANIWDIQTL